MTPKDLMNRVPSFRVALLAVAVCLASAAAPALAAPPVTLESLLHEMTDPAAVARIDVPAFTTHQASSYDRASTVPADARGWFANHDFGQFIRSEEVGGKREWVIMDADGPGAVTRFWLGGRDFTGQIRIYLDGDKEPVLAGGPAFPFLANLTAHPLSVTTSGGGPNLFLPIPYSRHCKITYVEGASPKPPEYRWYNIEYRSYEPGTPVESFTAADFKAKHDAIETAAKKLLNPAAAAGSALALDQSIDAGQQASLDLPAGSHAVQQIQLRITPADLRDIAAALRTTVIQIDCDGEQTVWAPAGDFFGSGAGLNELHSWYRTVEKDGTMTCRWVMPYERSAKITLLNLADKKITATLTATVGPWQWDDRSLHFHATWRMQNPIHTRPYSDWNYVTITGRGKYVGDSLALFNPVRDWWGEGDEKIRTDGESFPSHFGTGSEDYYCYSWGHTALFQTPFANQVRCDGPGNAGHTVVTRTRNLDTIPFSKSLQVDMEIWHWKETDVVYAVTSYWYAAPGATSNRGPDQQQALAPISAMPEIPHIAGAVECETMTVADHSPGLKIEKQGGILLQHGKRWSSDAQLWVRAEKVGEFIELTIPAQAPETRRLILHATRSHDYGILGFTVNGKPVAKTLDGYNDQAALAEPFDLGKFEPKNGMFTLRIEVTGANPASRGPRYYLGLDCIEVLKP